MSILITGGAKRCGRTLALNLAKQNEKVIITYYKTKAWDLYELENQGINCIACDLTQTSQVIQLIENLKADFSDLHTIIHNASLWLPNAKGKRATYEIEDLLAEDENMQRMFALHMRAPALINLALSEVLIANAKANNTSANIINFTDAVVQKTSDNHLSYAATKAGLENMTKSFAKKFAPFVRVNSIAPALLAFNDEDDDNYKEKTKSKHLLEPAPGFDVALQSVKFILENQYLTGSCITLDGGKNCL